MNNYQQRIRERAEHFYARVFPLGSHHMTLDDSAWKPDLMNLAKLSVDAEAEAYSDAYSQGLSDHHSGLHSISAHHMRLLGLIPPPENNEK